MTPGGLGAETAISLAHGNPSTLILLGRTQAKCQPTIDAVKAVDSTIAVKFVAVDLESMTSVRAAARAVLDDVEVVQIHALINNAAVMTCPYRKTEDGFERQFATNHLSHFVLTNELMPRVLAAGPGARIVNVASVANKYAGINWDDPGFDREGDYTPWRGYGQSKTANILSAIALNRRVSKRGVRTFAANPGSVSTNLQGYMTLEMAEEAARVITGKSLDEAVATMAKTLQQGCSTQLEAALDPALETEEKVFFNDCLPCDDPAWVAPWSLDVDAAERLWEMSEELVGEKFEY